MSVSETRRLAALADYRVLDTPEEVAFDNITEMSARLFEVPIALVSFVDSTRQWFKAHTGLAIRETPREYSFCDHAIQADRTLLVPDASEDERFRTNPLVTGDPHIRLYCGVPLHTPQGEGLGTLCLIDRVPRTLSEKEIETLSAIARQVEIELEIRRRLALLQEHLAKNREAQRSKELMTSMLVHDLRGPLTSLTLLTTAIKPADSGSQQALLEATSEVSRMRHMLNDVLDICLHQQGAFRLRKTELELQPWVSDLVRRMERITRLQGQPLLLELPESTIVVNADPEVLGRVLENLINNASHHGPADSAIRIKGEVSGGSLQIEVADGGRPIPAHMRDRIFAPFERIEAEGEMPRTGYGLGLSFCQLALLAHGGTIRVIENAAHGNSFILELPLE
ncbi:MAG: ATP-binding protein [Polyangiaceae bacterium]|nr:ATP-binding protein [Polyangiaceae bacterium]